MIINFGTAGKINPELHGLIGISTVLQRDMMTEPLAPRGQTPFCTKPSRYHSRSGQYICGSGDSFVTERDAWLEAQGVDVVDMELFAIAAVAHEFKIPWHAFKYITDEANDASAHEWQEKVNHGEKHFVEQLIRLINETELKLKSA